MSSNTESSLKILLVDDDEIWVKTMKAILEYDGEFIVDTALSGEEALDILKKVHPHIVLLDLNLGEDRMNGIECLDEMRDSGFEGPAFMLTGDSSIETFIRAMEAGADDYLVKGSNRKFLENEVRELFSRSASCRTDYAECCDPIQDSGYLRSFGLNDDQRRLLNDFFRKGFPRIKTLAADLGESEDAVVHKFKRIREKLCMESLYQVVHMLSAVEMAGKLRGGGGVENSISV